ncbi:MAG: hypothetical protein H6751_14965 [Candidatus Omnitrophica bacterium]|nr:hypothetical protein [Candidatus Omnitrophota bacterium]MCB9784262.1 hypothetical protein [Candidatus Omnitrophota bacterium]
MASYKATVKIEREGELTLHSIPFHPGEEVQVTVETKRAVPANEDRFPLRGSPYRFDNPFEPAISPEDWDALK